KRSGSASTAQRYGASRIATSAARRARETPRAGARSAPRAGAAPPAPRPGFARASMVAGSAGRRRDASAPSGPRSKARGTRDLRREAELESHGGMFNRPVADADLLACPDCDLLQRLPELEPGASARCPRCDLELWRRRDDSLHRALPLTLAAVVL